MHTKGPWVVQLEENDLEWAVMSGKYYVATCHDCAADGCTEDNANLVAAAPELLAACRACLDAIDDDSPLYSLTMQLAAAISKAEGATND